MVTAGVPIQQIDAAMVEFGMPLGPLELLDEIGLDTALQSGIVLAEIFGERSGGSELLVRLVKAQQYGMKAGAGFYSYPGKITNPSFGEIVAELRASEHAQRARASQPCGDRRAAAAADDRRGGAGCLPRKRLPAAWQIDLAMIFGLGFPLWRGGLLWWAEQAWTGNSFLKELFICDKLQYAGQ